MSELSMENESMESQVSPIWRTAFLMLGTFVLGAAIPLLITRNDINPETLAAALTPLQKQLDEVAIEQGQSREQISEIKVDIEGMDEDLKLDNRSTRLRVPIPYSRLT